MKKLFALFLLLCVPLSLALTKSNVVEAADEVPLSPYVLKLEDVITRRSLEGGVELNKQIVKTLRFGDTNENLWAENTYQYVTMPAQGNDAIKIVTWSEGTADEWKSSTVRKTALDFEEKNPGWIVVAAVNGDFFDINATYQPTSTFVQNGDIYKRDTVHEVIGFTGPRTHIWGKPTSNSYMSLKVLDGNNVTSNTPISKVNQDPEDSGITLLTTDFKGTVDLTGYTVYVGSYTVNRKTPKGYFVRGSITGTDTTMTEISQVPTGQFYLVTKDADYAELLVKGTTLKCEYELSGEFAGVKNVMGTRYQIIKEGDVQFQGKQTKETHSDYEFINNAHPRTVLGYKQDGSAILMVIDGRHPGYQRNGVSLFEAGELLRLAGALEGYNLDGGGSSTLVVRNEEGELEVINTPSDGGERNIGNAVLFVMQDPKIQPTKVVGNFIKFEQTGPIADGIIKDISVRVGGKVYPFNGNSVTVTGLNKNSNYNVTYYYTIVENDGTVRQCASKEFKIKTNDVIFPEIRKFEVDDELHLGVELSYRYSDDAGSVEEAYIEYGDEKIILTEKSGTIEISDLIQDETYEFKLFLKLKNGDLIDSDIVSVVAKTKTSTGGGGGGGCSTVLSNISLLC
jgi:hypothetical protein